MKRIVLSVFLFLGMTVPMATPAQAIFGLSTCEKVKKQIKSEEAIGSESWKEFNTSRKQFISDGQVTNGEMIALFRLVNLVHKSDLTVYSIATKNTKCFTPKMNAYIRNTQSETKRTFDVMEKGIKTFKSEYSNLNNQKAYDFLKTYYEKYISLYDFKLDNQTSK